MLILVAVTISMAVNGGLFEYAGKAVSETNKALQAEQQLANGGIEVDGEWYNSIDEYISYKKEEEKEETEEETEQLAGTWEFYGGEEVVYGFSGNKLFPVNFTLNNNVYVAIFVQDLGDRGGVVGFNTSVDNEFVENTYAQPYNDNDNPVSTWNSNISITITDTYDESTHAELLEFLRANATKVN